MKPGPMHQRPVYEATACDLLVITRNVRMCLRVDLTPPRQYGSIIQNDGVWFGFGSVELECARVFTVIPVSGFGFVCLFPFSLLIFDVYWLTI